MKSVHETVLVLLFALFLTPFLSAQSTPTVESRTDWASGVLQLDITAPIEEEPNQPTGRFKTEQSIIRQTPELAGDVLLDIMVDSTHSVSDLALKTPFLLRQLENLSEKMKKVFTTATNDRKHLTVRYTLDLFPDLVDLIIKHDKPYPSPAINGYVANEDFTGIIIFAGEALPFQGTVESDAELNPCLFPRLFDSSMNLIHSAEMTEPEALRKWGNAGYSYDLGPNDRVGNYPLRTVARKIYGTNRTDLILSDSAVEKLLSSEHNRNLLKEGRVLIILPSPGAEETSE